MKRIFNFKGITALLLAAVLMLGLCSCKKETGDGKITSSKVSSKEETVVSEYEASEVSSEEVEAANAVVRYYLYAPGKVLKTTFDVDYSVDGTITVNAFDKNNYKTGSFVYDYDENGLVTYRAEFDKNDNLLWYTTYEFNNLMKIDSEYYYEEEALRKTSKYKYNENGVLLSKTVETVGDNTVYTWDYALDGDVVYAIYISTNERQNVEGYTFANNMDGQLYQKYHQVNGYSDDYYMYDYDKKGNRNYRGHFDKSNNLIEYYSFTYGNAPDLAATAFQNTGILD